jgi:hypothetical protein
MDEIKRRGLGGAVRSRGTSHPRSRFFVCAATRVNEREHCEWEEPGSHEPGFFFEAARNLKPLHYFEASWAVSTAARRRHRSGK